MSLYGKIVRLAYSNPKVRKDLMPVLASYAEVSKLAKELSKIPGVLKVSVLREAEASDEREITFGLFLDPRTGAKQGKQMAASAVNQHLSVSLAKFPQVRLLKSFSPAPSGDPFGRPGVDWESNPEAFRKYYASNPYRVVVSVGVSKKASRSSVHVSTKELPDALKKALKSMGYNRPMVEVRQATTFTPASASAAFEGNRGVLIAVNLGTGQIKSETGSWGASAPTALDTDHREYPIPANGAVIIGETGYKTFAHILIHPSNFASFLPVDTKLTPEEEKALKIISSIKGGYRKDYFAKKKLGPYSVSNPVVQSLADKGMIKTNRGGAIQITPQGRTVASGIRDSFMWNSDD